jgi:hypothetical protein
LPSQGCLSRDGVATVRDLMIRHFRSYDRIALGK